MKKRLISLSIVVMLLVVALTPLMASAAGMTWRAYVKTGNGKSLNLRTGPSTDASIQKNIPYAAEVTILDLYNDSWAQVHYNGYEGFVMRRYLSYDKPTSKPSPSPTSKPSGGGTSISHLFDGFQMTSYYVAVRPSTPSGFVHMRWAPSKEATIIRDYHSGDSLEVLAKNKTWAQVRDNENGVTGFMMVEFLTEVGIGDGVVVNES